MNAELLKDLLKESETGNGTLNKAFSTFFQEGNTESCAVDKDLVIRKGRLIDMYCQPRYVAIPDHSHNFVELVYMYSGSTVHVINKKRKLQLETNDLLLLRQGTSHSIEPAGENDIAVHFFILPEFFNHPALILEEGSVLRHFIARAGARNSTVGDCLHFHLGTSLPAQNLLENMIWSLMGERKGRQEINRATMGILIMELLHEADKVEFHDLAQYEEQIVLTAYQYLEDNYPRATLEEFSVMTMQPSYCISRLFKRYFQMTFKECLQLIRLNRAANLLASTSKPVEEIIADIGYENSSYFHRLFKERYGMTPKQFRDKSRGQI
jgi:AraC-like DNA-binding protein/mannose-6-phosphate isomerase-like protein (cupin superfamily)